MITTKQMDIRANIKKYFDLAFNGEPIIVSRKENKCFAGRYKKKWCFVWNWKAGKTREPPGIFKKN